MWTRAELKQNAKYALSGKYWMAFAVSLVYGLLAGGSGGSAGGSSASTGTNIGQQMEQLEAETILMIVLLFVAVFVVAFATAYALQFFVSGPITVGKNRYYMENRTGQPSFSVLFHGFSHGYWRNAKAMFVTTLYEGLLSLAFVIPGIIAQLMWYQVPYILAENPNLSGKRAREISRAMTDGDKWEMFVLELSFLGWILLGALACGVGALFVAPYMEATYAELYARQREKVLSAGLATADELPGV